ncbi:MAG: DUF2490 domain-containing protein, partial [Candidatus Neomarinimicrobiota bacterium]
KRDEEHLRNRMLVEYKITKKFTPYFGAELFYLINNKKYRNGFDIFRYYTGVEYKITSKHYLEFTWIYEEVFNFGQREKENLYKLTVTIKLN